MQQGWDKWPPSPTCPAASCFMACSLRVAFSFHPQMKLCWLTASQGGLCGCPGATGLGVRSYLWKNDCEAFKTRVVSSLGSFQRTHLITSSVHEVENFSRKLMLWMNSAGRMSWSCGAGAWFLSSPDVVRGSCRFHSCVVCCLPVSSGVGGREDSRVWPCLELWAAGVCVALALLSLL